MFSGDIETDSMILYTILEPLDYYIGTERKSKQFKEYSCSKGGGSVLYGYTWKGYLKKDKEGNNIYRTKADNYKGLYQTKFKTENPELEDIFKEFTNLHAPGFNWIQVQVNKNYISPPHFDSANTGESIIIGLGDYTGGNLRIDRKSFVEEIDIRNRIYKFNGSQWKHWVSPIISGSRISVVFYNSKCLKDKLI
tara:strand:+ start:275 stop:856 length:582 start_codon:yes stop_codon:yes gene_type:complete